MEYEFYIDLFFLTDFYLNLLSLFLSAALLRQRLCFWRLCFAAAIGSFWNCFLIVFPLLPTGVELLVTILPVGGIMLVVAFQERFAEGMPQKSLQRFLQRFLSAEGSFLLAAGLVNGCYSFAFQHFYLSDLESLAFTGFICLFAERFLRYRYKRGTVGEIRYLVSLYYQGKQKKFLALVDSGNRLRIPDTGKPVSLISYRDCIGFCDTVSGGFYIPYRAVGTEKGMLFTVLFEKMEIQGNGSAITIEKPAVAIVKESLSVKGDFSMILPEEYVPGE